MIVIGLILVAVILSVVISVFMGHKRGLPSGSCHNKPKKILRGASMIPPPRPHKTSTKCMKEVLRIDEWTELHHAKLCKDIEVHLSVFLDDDKEDIYSLRRLIFISMRENMKEKACQKNKTNQ